MRRLWILISGYDDEIGLRRACESVRAIWPDPDRYPIIYADGAYERFPHADPRSPEGVFAVAEEFCSMVVPWPIASPTEFLKRTTYFAGNEGDYGLVLDTDETVQVAKPGDFPDTLSKPCYLIPLRLPNRSVTGRVSRLFRIRSGIHHWGAHELVAYPERVNKRGQHDFCEGIQIVHHSHWEKVRRDNKQAYYNQGIKADEAEFRRKVGS